MNTIALLIAAAVVVIGAACWLDPYTARLVAAFLRSHAAATEAGRKERQRVWRRLSKAAAISQERKERTA